jgi:internalin A
VPALRDLDINGTWVTDAGLAHLRGMTALRHLDLRTTQATNAGVEELRKALPNVEIEW